MSHNIPDPPPGSSDPHPEELGIVPRDPTSEHIEHRPDFDQGPERLGPDSKDKPEIRDRNSEPDYQTSSAEPDPSGWYSSTRGCSDSDCGSRRRSVHWGRYEEILQRFNHTLMDMIAS
jgi:hypothetical protein